MAKNTILRPVFNRPEMFYLSLKYEIEAREHYMLQGEFVTLFIIEFGAPSKIFELVEKYPFEKQILVRKFKYGLSKNILEGMKDAFNLSSDYIIYIEDDILIHKTYFQYLDVIINMQNVGKYSIISPYNQNDNGDVNEIYRGHHYAALAPLITKDFYNKYIYPISNNEYYNNPVTFSLKMNEKYKNHWESKRYKYTSSAHCEQAGIINRLVDSSMIDEGKYVIMPRINRQIHIGFWGKNRKKIRDLRGKTFNERLENLRNIIKDPNSMFEMAGSKQYNDYKIFSPKLNDWDGSLRLV